MSKSEHFTIVKLNKAFNNAMKEGNLVKAKEINDKLKVIIGF